MKLRFTDNKPLMVSMLILVAMAAIDVPMWINLFSWFLIALKILSEKKSAPTLSRRITAALSALLLVQIYFEFRTLLGQEPSTTLLLGLAALKIMDYETSRDHKYLVVLGFMLLAMKPLFSLDLYWIPFLFISFVGLWWSMLSRQQAKPLNFLSRLFVLSIPIALILFFIFPRFVFPWAHRANQNRAQMGFSERLNPGTSAELAESDKLVFRAAFQVGTDPMMESLYWRGGVLTESNGLSWSTPNLERKSSDFIPRNSENDRRINYDIYLEPGNGNYIFALETPETLFGTDLYIRSYQASIYRLPFAVNKTILYRGSSNLNGADTVNSSEDNLQIPALSSRIQDWVNSHSKKSEKDKIEELEMFYKKNKFQYTLNPGMYGKNDLEEFLFDKRKGFCEHFAGSYATLARALGIPARVVVGFHGGTWNGYGNFWRISTKDAHAWVEIFHDKKWQRVDPTAFAAPMRIELGATQFFNGINTAQTFVETASLIYNQILSAIENVNYNWTTFLLDFDKEFQKELITVIKENLGWYLFALLVLCVAVLFASRLLNRKAQTLHPYQLLFLDISDWASKKGLSRYPSESPRSYFARIANSHTEFQGFSEIFLKQYEAIFYQETRLAIDPKLSRQWRKVRKTLNSKQK